MYWPEILDTSAAASVFWGITATWVISESTIGRRTGDGSGTADGRGPRPKVLFAAAGVASLACACVYSTRFGGLVVILLGVGLCLAGIALRQWAVASLGEFFSTSIKIKPDHVLIGDGPYRICRHPSYLGALMSLTGLGLAMTNWISLLICVCQGLIVLVARIRYEERLLSKHFGAEFTVNSRARHRLVPGIW